MPISYYPNDPYKDRSNWPVGPGQLTSPGKRQHYQLGQWMRARYGDLLGPEYSEEVVRARSTDTDRTLMSAQVSMAGLFPPSDYMEWSEDLAWQPVPVHTVPQAEDLLLNPGHSACPRLTSLRQELEQGEYIRGLMEDNAELLKYLEANTGDKITRVCQVDWLYDTLLIESIYNKTLPSWTESVFPGGDFEKLRNIAFLMATWTEEMKRLQGGPFFSLVLSDWLAVANGNAGNMKMKLFYGHDDTLSFMLTSLNVYEGLSNIPPPYASGLILELYQDENSQYSVKMFYHPVVGGDPVEVSLPGCEAPCPLDKWARLTVNLTLDMETWSKECHEERDLGQEARTRTQDVVVLILLLCILCLVSVIIPVTLTASKCRRRRDYESI